MIITRAFTEDLHPRGTGALGGQFVAAGTTATKTAPPAKKGAKPAQKAKGGGGNLSFDGKRGPGYGVKGGDKRVRGLQEALNRLGLTDGSGKKLAVDGKLGPRTTAAIKKAQRAAGMKADGVATPAFLAQLAKAKKSGDLKVKPKKAAPAKKVTKPPAKKAAPARAARPVKRPPPGKRIDVGRSLLVGYSGRMTDIGRHLPGKHNQQTHANRLGKPSNVAGKTGLGKATAKLADQPEQGPSRAPARKELSAADVQDILKGDSPWYMGNRRKNSEHLEVLKKAGIGDDQAREILKDLGGDPDREWDTVDLGRALHDRAEREASDAAEAKRQEALAGATPAAFARLLGEDGQPALVKSKPVAKVFESMRANGWRMTAANGHGGYTFSSGDGGKSINVLAINGVAIYDSRHNKISGVKALALIEGT